MRRVHDAAEPERLQGRNPVEILAVDVFFVAFMRFVDVQPVSGKGERPVPRAGVHGGIVGNGNREFPVGYDGAFHVVENDAVVLRARPSNVIPVNPLLFRVARERHAHRFFLVVLGIRFFDCHFFFRKRHAFYRDDDEDENDSPQAQRKRLPEVAPHDALFGFGRDGLRFVDWASD